MSNLSSDNMNGQSNSENKNEFSKKQIYSYVFIVGVYIALFCIAVYFTKEVENKEVIIILFSAIVGFTGSMLNVLKTWLPTVMPKSTDKLDDKITRFRMKFLIFKSYDGIFLGMASAAVAISKDMSAVGALGIAFLTCYGIDVIKSIFGK